MKHEAVAVGGKHEGNIQRLGVIQRLLHAVADAMGVALRLDQRDGDVGLVVKDVIGPFAFPPADQLAPHDDAAIGEADLLPDLQHRVPARLCERRRDELGADIAFAEGGFVHTVRCFPALVALPVFANIAVGATVWGMGGWNLVGRGWLVVRFGNSIPISQCVPHQRSANERSKCSTSGKHYSETRRFKKQLV